MYTSPSPQINSCSYHPISPCHTYLSITQCPMVDVYYTLYIVHYTLYDVQCSLYTVHIVQCTVYTENYTLYNVQCTLTPNQQSPHVLLYPYTKPYLSILILSINTYPYYIAYTLRIHMYTYGISIVQGPITRE